MQILPVWVNDQAQGENGGSVAKVRFLLNLAAAYHNEDASLVKMADALGVSRNTIYAARQEGRVSSQLAAAIEMLVGKNIISRELFNVETPCL